MEKEQSLPRDLQALVDKDDIRTVISRFCRGSDRKIRSIVQSVYHPGAIDNHGFFNGPVDEFYDAVNQAPAVDCSHHLFGQTLIELEDNGLAANTETYCIITTVNWAHGEKEEWTTFLVRYIDRLEKLNNQWKVIHRVVVFEAAIDRKQFNALPQASLGTRDENDYSRKVFND